MEKKQIREELLKKRRELNINHRMDYGYEICNAVVRTEEYQNARIILSFLSMEDEVDMSYFDFCAYQDNKTLAYPVIISKGVMDAYIPDVLGNFETNRFGIREPILSKSSYLSPDRIDLVVVPMLGFDKSGYRIGYGGGYYDRFLQTTNAFKLGVCYQELMSESLPVSEHDVKLNAVITQFGRYDFCFNVDMK